MEQIKSSTRLRLYLQGFFEHDLRCANAVRFPPSLLCLLCFNPQPPPPPPPPVKHTVSKAADLEQTFEHSALAFPSQRSFLRKTNKNVEPTYICHFISLRFQPGRTNAKIPFKSKNSTDMTETSWYPFDYLYITMSM